MEKRKRDPGQWFIRILSTGLNPSTYFEILNRTEVNLMNFARVEDPEDFVDVCDQVAEREIRYAEGQFEQGNTYAAGEALYNASQILRFADYGLINPTQDKFDRYARVSDCFKRGLSMMPPHKHIPVEIPFEGKSLPGILTIPAGADSDVPVVIVMSGATGFKEEVFGMLGRIHNAGLATLIFDGPGQGEALFVRKIYYEVDNYEKAVSAVIDFVKADNRVGDRIALYGHSYGGYLSARSACFNNDKIDCIVSRGGCAKTTELVKGNYIKKFKMKIKDADDEKAFAAAEQMTLEGCMEMLTKPLLVIQGERDHIYGSTEGSKYIYEHASSTDKEYYEVKHASHGGGLSIQTEQKLVSWLLAHLMQ